MAFASAEDVAERFPRDLTVDEEVIADAVIASVTGQITDAVDRDSGWAAALDPVPETFKALCVEKAISAISNPMNVASESETLGAWSRSQTFPRLQDVGALLTAAEERRVRQAWYGLSASARTTSVIDDVLDHFDDGEIDGSLGS